MEIRIDFEELKKLEAQLRAAPEVVHEELLRAMTWTDALLVREVKERTPLGAGGRGSGLAGSIIGQVRVKEFGVEDFVSSPLNYVEPVELGTKPHFPPVDALVDWVKARISVKSETEARGIAFLIARKISRQGTKGAGMFERAFTAVEPQIRARFEEAAADIAARITGGGRGA